jgi:hypothetical protein
LAIVVPGGDFEMPAANAADAPAASNTAAKAMDFFFIVVSFEDGRPWMRNATSCPDVSLQAVQVMRRVAAGRRLLGACVAASREQGSIGGIRRRTAMTFAANRITVGGVLALDSPGREPGRGAETC